MFNDEGDGARIRAYMWGRDIGRLTTGFIGLIVVTKGVGVATAAYTGIVKTARFGMLAYETTVKAIRIAKIAYISITKGAEAATIAMSTATGAASCSGTASPTT